MTVSLKLQRCRESSRSQLRKGMSLISCDQRFPIVYSRATTHTNERSIPMLDEREILGIRSIFRNNFISVLNIERLTVCPAFGGPATSQPRVLTLRYFAQVEHSHSFS